MAKSYFQSAKRRDSSSAAPVLSAPSVSAEPYTLDEELLTAEQVMAKLSLPSVYAVNRLVRSYGLPRVQLGARLFRFRAADVAAWVRDQNVRRSA